MSECDEIRNRQNKWCDFKIQLEIHEEANITVVNYLKVSFSSPDIEFLIARVKIISEICLEAIILYFQADKYNQARSFDC